MRGFAALVLAASLAVNTGCGSRGSAATMMGHSGEVQQARAPAQTSSEPRVVRSISLPHDEGFAPPGSGREDFVAACVVCHSPRYITSQPRFSRAVWKGIVQKMIDAYGAHITAPQAAEIVDYLVATNGANSIGEER